MPIPFVFQGKITEKHFKQFCLPKFLFQLLNEQFMDQLLYKGKSLVFLKYYVREAIHFQPLKQLSILECWYVEWKNFSMYKYRFEKDPIFFLNFISQNKFTMNFFSWRFSLSHTSL